MFDSLGEELFKKIGGFGITEYQKNRLTKEALKHGELFALVPCSSGESGVLGYQNGQVAITKSMIIFGQTGKATQIGLKIRLSWLRKFPIEIFRNSTKVHKEYLWGAHKVEIIKFNFENCACELAFTMDNIEKFESALSKALK